MKKYPCNPRVMELLSEKSSVKQEVFRKGKDYFAQLKELVGQTAHGLQESICEVDDSVKVEFKDKGIFECELYFSGDVLLFNMHSNVFTFNRSNFLWRTGYIKEDPRRAYFAMVNIYNFMADSFRYNRYKDVGVLLGRLFINREGHFFVEGKRHLGFVFSKLGQQKMDTDVLKKIIDTSIIQGLEYDLTVPNYRDVMVVSVKQIKETSDELHLKTGKQVELGYYSRMQGRKKNF